MMSRWMPVVPLALLVIGLQATAQSVRSQVRRVEYYEYDSRTQLARRAELRRASETISGWELANTLTSYSNGGADYVDTLHTIMRVNRLTDADDAYLTDGPIICLVPVGDASK